MRSFIFLITLWLYVTSAFAQSAFVAPTASGTAATGQLPGTTTNDAAAAGKIGETADATAALNSVSLTSGGGGTVNVTSVSLTAGDWEINGIVYYLAGGTTTISQLHTSIGATTATSSTTLGQFTSIAFNGLIISGTDYFAVVIPNFRVSLSGTTTYYLVTAQTFGVSTLTAGGSMHARRVR